LTWLHLSKPSPGNCRATVLLSRFAQRRSPLERVDEYPSRFSDPIELSAYRG
jgi:hypothetical protein